jgi:hypothetical protein
VKSSSRGGRARGTGALIGALCALALLGPPQLAAARTLRPNKRGDHAPNGCSKHDCTLREAVIEANAHAGADKIVLRGGHAYNLSRAPSGTNDASTGDLNLLDPVTIASSNRKLATVDANELDRVFRVADPSTLVRLEITGGKDQSMGLGTGGGGIALQPEAESPPGRTKILRSRIVGNQSATGGGGIAVGGLASLTVSRTAIRGNVAESGGGVSAISPSLRISKSTIAGNTANALSSGDGGGGIVTGLRLTLTASTVSGNRALGSGAQGGGILTLFAHANSEVKLTNDTIAQNAADNRGGGFANTTGTVDANAVTVARNVADADGNSVGTGGGLLTTLGTSFEIRNSLVALNHSDVTGPDCAGVFASGGQNLVGKTAGCGGFTAADFTNVPATKVKLSKLRDNGGPTKTAAIRRGSKAINHGGGDTPKRDQRGVHRHDPDIGAFERG